MLGSAVRRWLHRVPAPVIPDLFDDYLFDVPARLPLPSAPVHAGPAVAIVGGKLLFSRDEVGQPRGGRALFEETMFGDVRMARLLDGTSAPAADPRWSDGAIAPRLRVDSAMPLDDAVRASLSDMVYFRCHQHEGSHYTGGVIDLFPIELARCLAASVAMERKGSLNTWLVAPAWRAVLGIDGNARLRAVHGQQADVWIDTADMPQALRGHGLEKTIRWRENRLRLIAPASYDTYRAQVEAQWQYGYRKGHAAFTRRERA
jgi:hypothetical protein